MENKQMKGGLDMETQKSDTFTIRKDTLWKYSTFALLGVVILLVVLMVLPGKSPTGNVVNQQGQTLQPTQRAQIDIGNAPVIGDKNAPVTIVEFSDFSCPFCAAASGDNEELVSYMKQRSASWEPIVTNVMKDYVQTGKVKIAVKYMMGHSGGHPAQLVAWCLNDQSSDLYWKFYPKAFANQADVEDLAKMTALAKTVGADMGKLQSCLDSKKYDSRFDDEQNEGIAAGAQGTPSFFVNGQLVSGAVPYSQIKALIESELSN
jgi:protein-disulfide isomerase